MIEAIFGPLEHPLVELTHVHVACLLRGSDLSGVDAGLVLFRIAQEALRKGAGSAPWYGVQHPVASGPGRQRYSEAARQGLASITRPGG